MIHKRTGMYRGRKDEGGATPLPHSGKNGGRGTRIAIRLAFGTHKGTKQNWPEGEEGGSIEKKKLTKGWKLSTCARKTEAKEHQTCRIRSIVAVSGAKYSAEGDGKKKTIVVANRKSQSYSKNSLVGESSRQSHLTI